MSSVAIVGAGPGIGASVARRFARVMNPASPSDTPEDCHMTAITGPPGAATDASPQHQSLPEIMQLTAATIRALREAGYQVSEQRAGNWLYLLARSSRESAVYKLVGPLFRGQAAIYEGVR